eukprot:CAMPEP_0170520514 /NCGR_PEP_ID=MMETSP0209-20121228/5802_1 /TAXON_ID=665100 ORGANISM="Litonotus pictus, Strain P1" /NCGR_SAMPLE_ID=MMETSP0209 /ASSEMBLY_ACC=CAM_ASM_000301 /LENGTH=155 /DNA_ID=CAMNT_0010806831 /DNA_START=161 /DNA_END=628 /DNA_ORIENTATION=-
MIFLNIFSFYLSALIMYAGQMETLFVDKKNNKVSHSWMNLFLSKKEKTYLLSDLEKVIMVYKGHHARSNDMRRYYIRLKFKNEKKFDFGECLSFRKLLDKYEKVMAIMKGETGRKVDRSLLKDETTSYEDEDFDFRDSDEENESLLDHSSKLKHD